MRTLGTILLIILLVPSIASAQQTAPVVEESTTGATPEQPLASFFSETTVTATGSERNVFDIATPVTVIREEKIAQKSVENAADLLREQPGVDVNGVGPTQARPVIRGQRGLRVLFLEDGLRLNNPRRQADFGEIGGLVDLHNVSTIEVVRGPASVLYGSDAIGGVMNAISKEPSFPTDSNLAGYIEGRHSTAGDLSGLSAGLNARLGRLTLQIGGTKRSANDYSIPAGNFGDITIAEGARTLDTGVDDTSAWGSLSFTPAAGHNFRLRLNRYRAGETGFGYVPADQYGATEATKIRILYPEQSFDRATFSYTASSLQRAWADSTSVQIYHQSNARELVNDIEIDIGPVAPGFPHSAVQANTLNLSDLNTWGFRADAVKVLAAGRHIATYGLEGTRDASFNTDFSTTITTIRTPHGNSVTETTDDVANAPNATNTAWGIFAQDEISIGRKLLVTAGARFNSVETVAKATPAWDVTGLGFSDRRFVGALSAKYQLNSTINLLASYGRGFRAPNIIERLFNGATPEGSGYQLLNPALDSETSDNFDLGIKYSRASAFMEAVAFRNDIKGGVIQAFLSPAEIAGLDATTRAAIAASHAQFVVQQRNAAHLRYEGVELALGWRSSRGIVLGGNYTWINGERIDAANPPTGDSYSRKTFAYARYEPSGSRFWAEYHVRHNGEENANIAPNEPVPPVGLTLPAFTVHGIGAGARLFEFNGLSSELTLWIENATNELYAEFSNATFFRPEPGRTMKVSYRVTF
ncbi:MAG: hemoglobin/transferrin/lactoferrin receptor protein [Acidobacteriota bacterium]|nr:hemoglobin/transferrin/lactoferrin receptor protein [Acidobacteriota bacterium]